MASIGLNQALPASTTETRYPASGHPHFPQFVADVFVKLYYNTLHKSPKLIHRFYKDESTLSRPGADGSLRSITTMKNIRDAIMNSYIKHWHTIVLDVQAQNTLSESVIVVVLGYLSNNSMFKHFSQTFLLAPQTRGYYVRNDFLEFSDASSPTIPNEVSLYLMKGKGTYAEDVTDARINQIANDSSDTNNLVLLDESKISSAANTEEDIKKLSYASIGAKATSVPSDQNDSVQILPSNVEYTTTEAPHMVLEKKQNDKSNSSKESTSWQNDQVRKAISLPIPPQLPQQVLADKPSTIKTVLVKDIPPNATRRTLAYAFKVFGPVKHHNIDIRRYSDGYSYAFVEFNQQKSARLAIETGFIKFGTNWESQIIEAKRS